MTIFDEKQGKRIVDTILLGYNSYLRERIDKNREMLVSGGYAWTRANHLDDAFARAGLPFVTKYDKDRAGESWEYLKFSVVVPEIGNVLLLIKNGYRLEQTFSATKKSSEYLVELAKMNDGIINQFKTNISETNKISPESIQLDLFGSEDLPNSSEIQSEYDAFFVLVYETDANKHIMSIVITLLDSQELSIIELQDLSKYIALSDVAPIQDEELQNIEEQKATELQEFPYLAPAAEREAE